MKKKVIYIVLLIVININFFSTKLFAEENNILDVTILEEEIVPDIITAYDENIKNEFIDIYAPNALLGRTDTGEILYEKNIDEKIYPASLTKLLTAILVVESCELDEIVTVSENAVKSVPSGYVNANLQVGEELTVEDLLYVMLIPSANDAANALAEYVGGNIESFSSMMNTRAKEIGCTGSNFTNPSGLHQEEHFSTTRDQFYIANEAIKNQIIKKIMNTTSYTLPQTNKYSGDPRIFTTTNYLLQPSLSKFYTEECIGGKTGYTEYAKNCVIEYASKNDINLTAVILGEKATVKGQKFLDAKKMFEYMFNNYSDKKIVRRNSEYKTINIKNGTKETKNLRILFKEDIDILMNKNSIENYEESVTYYKETAPINKGEVVGKINYKYNGRDYFVELIANNNVEKSNINIIIIIILIIFFIFIFIIYLMRKSNNKIGQHGKIIFEQKSVE